MRLPRKKVSPLAGLTPVFVGIVLVGCASKSASSIGLSYSGGAMSPDPQRSALVMSAGPGAMWQGSPQDARRPLTAGMLLPEGALVDSDSEGETILSLPGAGGQMKLAARTRILLSGLTAERGTAVFVANGQVEGKLHGGSLELSSVCGGSLLLTPNPGAEVPFSFGSQPSREIFNAMIGLGLNPDMLLQPLPSEAGINSSWGPKTYVASVVAVVPEPATLSLLGFGVLALIATAYRAPRD